MSSSFRVPPVPSSGEIDLAALLSAVWQKKKIIMLAAIGFGLVAACYAFLATPQYQISSVLKPAALNELDALNRSEVYKLPPSEALIKVGASLESYDTRLGFFRANQKLFERFVRPGQTLEQSFEEFNRNSIELISPDPTKMDSLSANVRIEMTYPKGVDGVSILNGFVDYAIEEERHQIAADMDVIVKNRLGELNGKLAAARANYDIEKEARIESLREADNLKRAQLQDELKALRNQLKAQRADRMAQLGEAIGIAASLGIKKPTTPSAMGDVEKLASATTMRTEINNQQTPLYFMGVDALEAERAALVKRKSDDFTEGRIAQIAKELQLLQANREVEVLSQRKKEDLFLVGVQPLRSEMARLQALNIDMSRIKLVNVDKLALEPLAPIKPKRILIVLLGVLLGGLLALLVVVCRYLVSRNSASATQVNMSKAALTEDDGRRRF
ncbi:Wzz/FepE/Etk N-terminal domain-containing protein [Pseudomonas orientalis]|uniref:Chain-length determining protein n=1 Tax=Pseudomonas orientalis TaxID=76758 RepID=A0A2L0RTY2_9PSED|nr:Wzz/FepE/Etk N-terminal domain-containing protein [Pseudomonas orientalis]AUZ45519.1 chain-length determining protein [Pseudomonas orientalis]